VAKQFFEATAKGDLPSIQEGNGYMGGEGNPRYARIGDIDSIYELCCKVGLNSDVEHARKKGFLITDYANHPEIRESFKYDIDTRKNPFYVFERDGSIKGILIVYSKEQWMEEGSIDDLWKEISWDEDALDDIGIRDINNCNFAVLKKIASDPDLRKSGVSSRLLKTYIESQRENSILYLLSFVVADIYDGNKSLGIENSVSKGFHEKINSIKVGTSGIHQESKTYLGENGMFKYHVFMFPLNDAGSVT
jgi:hypothetical protein